MTDYGWAKPHEEDQLLDFANYVFSLDGAPTDFKQFHPRVYGRPGSSKVSLVAREDGQIKGLISAVTGHIKAGEQRLKYGFIGTVSVHPYFRGRGYMKQLMPMTMDALKEQGCQIIVLGGQRQRYRHFGFEDAGSLLQLYFTRMSLRHSLGSIHSEDFKFVPLEEAGEDALKASIRLHQSRDYYSERKEEDFLLYMKTWAGKAYAVHYQGQYAGYFYVIRQKIAEFGLADEGLLPQAIYALMLQQGWDSLSLPLMPHQAKRYEDLFLAADGWQISPPHNLLVVDWAGFLSTLLQFKANQQPLQDGQAVLGISGEGNHIITVQNGKVRVEKTDTEAALTLGSLAAIRLCTLPLGTDLYPDHPFRDWFPLPFMIPEADCF